MLDQLGPKFIDAETGAKSGDRFQLVQRSARMSQRAAGDHRDGYAGRGSEGRRDQAGFIADAAGGMFIHLDARHRREVYTLPGIGHALGQGAHLTVRHAGENHRHKKGGYLVIRDGAAGIPVNEESDFFGR